MSATIPPMDPRPLRTTVEMGMAKIRTPTLFPRLNTMVENGRMLEVWSSCRLPTLCGSRCTTAWRGTKNVKDAERLSQVRTNSGSYSGDSANLHHEVWQRQALDLNYRGGREYRLSEDLILEPAASLHRGVHVDDKEDLVHYIVHRSAEMGEHSFDVGVSLTHLAFHGAWIKDFSGFIMVDLPRYVDRVADLHGLGIAVTRFPRHPHIEDFFLDRHVLTPLQAYYFDASTGARVGTT